MLLLTVVENKIYFTMILLVEILYKIYMLIIFFLQRLKTIFFINKAVKKTAALLQLAAAFYL
jgi:hypothetical protein